MSAVHDLYALTEELYDLSKMQSNDDAEKIIDEMNTILDKCDAILKKMDITSIEPPEKLILEKVVEMDKEIQERYKRILFEISQKIRDIKKAKKTQKNYINPYSQVNQVSRFFDKKN